MQLRYFTPREDLRAHIGVYYVFEADAPTFQPMCAEMCNIRFVLSGGVDLIWPDGRKSVFHGASVIGPTMAAYGMEASGVAKVFGAGVLPLGWDALFGVNAESVTDKIEDYEAVSGVEVSRALERFKNAEDDQTLVQFADEFFANEVKKRRVKDRAFLPLLEQWLLAADCSDIDDLMANADISRRQADRLAKHYFGASPKALQRKYRALLAVGRITNGEADNWMDASGEAYYDQSHFIKEFKTFVGTTPKAFLRHQADLMEQSIKLRARATHKRPGVTKRRS